MGESKAKASMNDIFEVLEQQKKLEEIKGLIFNALEKVNQTVNAITVENLQLTRSELDVELIEDELPKDQPIKQESVLTNFSIEHSVLVNSQLLDIEIKPCFNDGEIETDEELDQL